MHAFREKAKYVDRAARRLETRKVPAAPPLPCLQRRARMRLATRLLGAHGPP
jgi:hypothetical protein